MADLSGAVQPNAPQSQEWELEVDLEGADLPPRGGWAAAGESLSKGKGDIAAEGFELEVDLGDTADLARPVAALPAPATGLPPGNAQPASKPAQLRGWSLPFNAPRPQPRPTSQPVNLPQSLGKGAPDNGPGPPPQSSHAGTSKPPAQTLARAPSGPSQEAKDRAAAIAAANRGRGFKSRLGGASSSSIFREAPKPKQNVTQGWGSGSGPGAVVKRPVPESSKGLMNEAAQPRTTKLMTHEAVLERKESIAQAQREAAGGQEPGAEGLERSGDGSNGKEHGRKANTAPAWPFFPASVEGSGDGEGGDSGTKFSAAATEAGPATWDSPAVTQGAAGSGGKGRRASHSSIKRMPKKALRKAYGDDSLDSNGGMAQPAVLASRGEDSQLADETPPPGGEDGGPDDREPVPTSRAQEPASLAFGGEGGGWNKQQAKNPFITDRSLLKNEQFRQQVQQRRERAEAPPPGKPLELGTVLRSLQRDGPGKENAGTSREAVVDLTADVEISPLPPSYQPAFSRAPVRPTVLSDDDDDSTPDPGGDMEWEDAPRASDRNCVNRQHHAPGDSHGGSSEPWWHRFPDFVPVDALIKGYNPRTGCPVHIDYRAQFQEEAPTGGGARNRAVPTKKQAGVGKKPRTFKRFKRGGKR